ncbi:MAG: KEOPS complex subunit Pcc1 [Candidatus Thermoplasmatota archaeon]|nr:KEOPS complex subunit Pcc1 [Candidatus Thermoplasmatota archaeon]
MPSGLSSAVRGALDPELQSPPSGSFVAIDSGTEADGHIVLDIASADLTSHRASLNSYLGLVQAVVSALDPPPLKRISRSKGFSAMKGRDRYGNTDTPEDTGPVR